MSTMLPTHMRAWRRHRSKPGAILEEVPVPAIPSNGFLLRVIAAGVCHTDYIIVNLPVLANYYDEKFTLGHEGCGEIVGIGNDVVDKSLQLGDRVVVLCIPGCGGDTCRECSGGMPQLCSRGKQYGLGQDGSFTDYVAVHERAVVPLPENVPPMVGAVSTDAVLTGFNAIFRRGEVKKGDLVFLFGLGGLGFNALQMMLCRGIRVIVSDIKEELLKEAVAQGVNSEDVVPIGTSPREFMEKKGLDSKIDVVMDFVGLGQTFSDAQKLVRRGGKIVLIGALAAETSVDMMLCSRKGVSVLFSFFGRREDLFEVLRMISRGEIRPQVKVQKLADFAQVIEDLHAGKLTGRVVLAPEGGEAEAKGAEATGEKL